MTIEIGFKQIERSERYLHFIAYKLEIISGKYKLSI